MACSSCGAEGHNKRTCGQLKEYGESDLEQNHISTKNREELAEIISARRTVFESLVKVGLGIGSIVDDNFAGRSMVTGIDWNQLMCEQPHHKPSFTIVPLASFSGNFDQLMKLDRCFVSGKTNFGWITLNIVISPMSRESIEETLPRGWLAGE